MQYNVLESFVDKNTKEVFKKGAEYQTEDNERAEYLIEKGYLEKPAVLPANEHKGEKGPLDKTVAELESEITVELPQETLIELLEQEKQNKNRKGVIEHIETLIHEKGLMEEVESLKD